MKKTAIALSLAATLLGAYDSIIGEFGSSETIPQVGINLNAGAWYITWEQTSTSKDFLNNQNDALEVTYDIDPAVAAMVDISLNYHYLIGNLKYYTNSGIQGYDANLALLKFIPFVNFEVRFVNTDFKGKMDAKDKTTGTTDYAEFKSPLEIYDIILYPLNEYIGFGYRSYKYELPQDFYLIDNTTGSIITNNGKQIKGWSDIQYSGSFYTAVIDNKKQVDARNIYNGFVYSAIFGIGKLKPKNLEYSILDAYTADSDATFYDVSVGYSYKKRTQSGFGYGLGVGYRYNKIETKMNKVDGIASLATEFNTLFHGPYMNLNLSY